VTTITLPGPKNTPEDSEKPKKLTIAEKDAILKVEVDKLILEKEEKYSGKCNFKLSEKTAKMFTKHSRMMYDSFCK
jgi:hypothetical protein